jgi:hypothetical protein
MPFPLRYILTSLMMRADLWFRRSLTKFFFPNSNGVSLGSVQAVLKNLWQEAHLFVPWLVQEGYRIYDGQIRVSFF